MNTPLPMIRRAAPTSFLRSPFPYAEATWPLNAPAERENDRTNDDGVLWT